MRLLFIYFVKNILHLELNQINVFKLKSWKWKIFNQGGKNITVMETKKRVFDAYIYIYIYIYIYSI